MARLMRSCAFVLIKHRASIADPTGHTGIARRALMGEYEWGGALGSFSPARVIQQATQVCNTDLYYISMYTIVYSINMYSKVRE